MLTLFYILVILLLLAILVTVWFAWCDVDKWNEEARGNQQWVVNQINEIKRKQAELEQIQDSNFDVLQEEINKFFRT